MKSKRSKRDVVRHLISETNKLKETNKPKKMRTTNQKTIKTIDLIRQTGWERMDLFVRWMYIEARENGKEEEIEKAFNLYTKLQKKRLIFNAGGVGDVCSKGYFESKKGKRLATGGSSGMCFDDLIDSIKENGYDKKSKIMIDSFGVKSGKLEKFIFVASGSHRVACCLAFGIEEIPIKIGKKTDPGFPLDWFTSNGFSKKEVKSIISFYNKKIKQLMTLEVERGLDENQNNS